MSSTADKSNSGLVVIGAGLMRTGTMSLKFALERLLGGECYHMATVIQNPNHAAFWQRMVKDTVSHEEIRAMMGNYTAAVDFPPVVFYQRLMCVYPNAKVVLSVRDPKAWYHSVNNTLHQQMKMSFSFPLNLLELFLPGRGHMRQIRPMILGLLVHFFGDGFELDHLTDEAFMLRKYEDHVAEVKATVPADRLLVFEAKDGWDPLCHFLDVPEPDEPYPHVNATSDHVKAIRRMQCMRRIAWTVTIGAVAVVAYVGKRIYETRLR